MDLDLSTVLLQWAAGGLLGLWVTDRHRLVGVGYGWLLRGVFAALALAGVLVGLDSSGAAAQVRSIAGLLTVVVSLLAVVISVRWRKTPARIPPGLDFLAALTGFVAVFTAAGVLGGPVVLTVARLGVGAIFLGFITDAMLLGHWYLVQPGLSRAPLREMIWLSIISWPIEVVLLLIPTGMVSLLNGSIDDGYGGILGVTWVVCALTTVGLLAAALAALKEPYYSAVMAATGLLYLAILTAFGTDVLARALLAG